jgi:hypothetical protein
MQLALGEKNGAGSELLTGKCRGKVEGTGSDLVAYSAGNAADEQL